MGKKFNTKPNIQLGQLVRSRCGRDSGNNYLVVQILPDNEHVLCSDGKFRKLANPKKKRIKHVVSGQVVQSINQKLMENKKVFDSEVFSAIKSSLEQVVIPNT